MAAGRLPPQAVLLQRLDYNVETGALTWRQRPLSDFRSAGVGKTWNKRYAGRPALSCADAHGYLAGCIGGVGSAKAHRIIWKMMTGGEPPEIDHINGARADNRWLNLRAVSHAENGRNQKRRITNASGVNGVCFDKSQMKWMAQIRAQEGNKFLGHFTSLAEAAAARKAAERRYGYHQNHGRD